MLNTTVTHVSFDLAGEPLQTETLLKWLSPSYWLVEAQLTFVVKQRGKDTLGWARDMPEFQTWQYSDTKFESKKRILWIHGPLGVGKTVMAGYFVELLKSLHPQAVIAFFFCRKGELGLTKVRDIVRTLAYYQSIQSPEAQKALDSLRKKSLPIDDNVGVGFLFDKLLREPLNVTKKESYIVLDGLDEADLITLDTIERPPRPEMEILLEHLARLSSARILLVSRGESNVSRFIPNSITKRLRKDDNKSILTHMFDRR